MEWDLLKVIMVFLTEKDVGSGYSFEGKNKVIVSNWEGVFTTNDGDQLTFKGRDMNREGKFVVIERYLLTEIS